jgi:hypothetical protein
MAIMLSNLLVLLMVGVSIVWGQERSKGEEEEEEGVKQYIGHEDSVGVSVCKVHISAIRWRFYT